MGFSFEVMKHSEVVKLLFAKKESLDYSRNHRLVHMTKINLGLEL